jgi:uncharacterized protein with HEPN domain
VKDPLLYIIHIHQSLQKILDYTRDGRAEFMVDPKTQDAVVRNFEVIGEATKRLSPEFTAAYPEIPWRRMAGFRDILIHAYDRVDIDEIWNIIEQHVSHLLTEIDTIRKRLQG